MKIENISSLLFALIRKEKERAETAFQVCIANEKEGSTKTRLVRAYEEFRRYNSMVVPQNIPPELKPLVFVPYREILLEDLCLSEDILKSTEQLLLEWDNYEGLAEKGLQATNKILLEGPPGNGKTSYATALAKKLGLPLLLTGSSMTLNSLLGGTEKNLNTLFQKMPDHCVLFFDEFDAVASERMGGGESSGTAKAWNSIVTGLLSNMERIRPYVLFIAATNRFEALDDAIVRRFDKRLVFSNPTAQEKNNYVERYMKKYGLSSDDFFLQKGQIDTAVSYSAVELVMKQRHKELVLADLIKKRRDIKDGSSRA